MEFCVQPTFTVSRAVMIAIVLFINFILIY